MTDKFRLREVGFRGDGPGKTFKAPDGALYNVVPSTLPGVLNFVRVTITAIDENGRPTANLGYRDIRYTAEDDIQARMMAHVTETIRGAEDALAAEDGAARVLQGWGIEPARADD